MVRARHAVILPVILIVLVLIGLLGAMFSFRVHADVASVQAVANRFQTTLAAQAGVEAVKLLLRTARFDRTQWYHNPEALHRVLVWAQGEDSRSAGTTDELEETRAYRFSIVADDPTDDERYIRFGITDEASKLNLNAATPAQLLTLVETVAVTDSEGEEAVQPQAIVDAIVDWRDADNKPNGEAADTEGEYYLSLDKPYGVKNGLFSSVEELLLVKGVTGSVLYGEDFDRNGLLTPNEDDGDDSFPPDNRDGELTRGLYPYVTVMSRETDVDAENRKRIYLFTDEGMLKKALEDVFPDRKDVIDFIAAVTRTGPVGPGGSGKPGGSTPKPGSGGKPGDPTGQPPGTKPGTTPPPTTPPTGPATGPQPPRTGVTAPTTPRRPASGGATPEVKPPPKKKAQDPGATVPPVGRGRGSQQPAPASGPKSGTPKPPTPGTPPITLPAGDAGQDEATPPVDELENPPVPRGTGEGASGPTPIRSPASLLWPRMIGDQPHPSPLTEEDLPVLMDRLTTRSPKEREVRGLINISTASREVLKCLEGLKEEQINGIIAARDVLEAEELATPAWVVTQGIVDVGTFELFAPYVTARGQQFTIESLGYADHMGMVTRLQVVVDMVGPIANTIYYRDISYLGGAFPIREEDKEQVRGR